MKYPHFLTIAALFAILVASEAIRVYNGDEAIRHLRDAAPPTPAQPTVQEINYRPYSQVPAGIKQLLQFQQAREQLVHIPVQAPPQLSKTPTPGSPHYQPQVQYAGQQSHQAQPGPAPQYQQQPQAAYQQQQRYQRGNQQIQQAYNPAGNSQGLFTPQQYQHPQNLQRQQRGHPENIFSPEQRQLY